MKRELTLKDILGYLHHPLLGQHSTGAICWIDLKFVVQHGIVLAGYKPVVRPMMDLNKEITDSNYNEGKPFIPIVELAKIIMPNESWCLFEDTDKAVSNRGDSVEYDVETGSFFCYSYCEAMETRNQLQCFDFLNLLRFDYRGLLDEGLAISVHDLPQDPYATCI